MHALVDSDHRCRFRQHEESKMKAYGCVESAFLDEKKGRKCRGQSRAIESKAQADAPGRIDLRRAESGLPPAFAGRRHPCPRWRDVRVHERLLQPIVGHPRGGSQLIFRRGSHMAGMKNIMT